MKIAICLSGQPRSINFAYKSILNYFSGNYEVDYFCHSWNYNTWKLQKLNYSGVENIPYHWIEEQLLHFNPKAYLIETKNELIKAGGENVPYGSLTYSAMMANHLKKMYEYKNNFRYDYVVKARFDSVFYPQLKFQPAVDIDHRFVFVPHLGRIGCEFNRLNASDCIYYGDSWGMDIMGDFFRYLRSMKGHFGSPDNPDVVGPGSTAFLYATELNTHVMRTPHQLPEIFYRKEALGLDVFNDFDKILEIHSSFYKDPDK